MIKMLVTCPECEGKISETAVVCPHCGFRGWFIYGDFIEGAAHCSPEMTQKREELDKVWEKRRRAEEEKAAQLAAEKKRRAREQEIQETRERRQREGAIIAFIGFILFMAAVVGAIFGIKYLALEIWRFISALF